MRYGVLADVHANLLALEAVLTSLDRTGVDRIIVAGDLVGYGPWPNQVVERLRDVDAVCVAGNHDLYAAGRLQPGRLPELVLASIDWTARRLDDDVRAHLANLPTVLTLDEMVVAHGSVGDPEEYTSTPRQAERELRSARRLVEDASMLVLGHTHRQWLYEAEEGDLARGPVVAPLSGAIHLLNPGSVGQSRQQEPEPLARFAVVDTSAGTVTLDAIAYDSDAARLALAEAGLPRENLHLLPTVRSRWAPRPLAGRLRRRLRRRSSRARLG